MPRRLPRPQHPGCPRPILPAQHIYFAGRRKSSGPVHKIVAFEPFSDGFGIMRDAQTAKPQTFRTGDGWFAYQLVTNLARPRVNHLTIQDA